MTALSDLIRQLSGDIRQALGDRTQHYDKLLKRSSLLTSFDADIYDQLLSKGLSRKKAPVPLFKEFVAHRDVAALPNSDGQYYVKHQRRMADLSQWTETLEERQSFSKQLVRYYQEKGSEIDIFAQRIFADPPQALKDFRRLYAEADKRFDLAACEMLLRILRNRVQGLTPALTAALNDREEYFQSRSRFADDWARTTHFLPRENLTLKFERFLQGRKRWIFHMHAAGGIGKTAYLRWLISRYCVVERGRARKRIPVARIDFDHVHLAEIDRAPWLVLLPIANQLTVQLRGNPFQTFLKEFGEHQKLVDRPARRTGLPFSSGEAPAVAGLEDSALHQFTDALGDHRILLVFDTLEEVVLHHGATLISMLELLGRLHARRPEVWVILSGRYDIRKQDRFTEAARKFGDRMRVVEVKPFTRAQSLEYLVKMRGLRPDDSVRDSHLPARGNPFKLALFADLLGKADTFNREDLRRFPTLEINYFIERIIERIPDDQQPLRWALRYAVIPHDLTKDFLVKVLRPHLGVEISRSRAEPLDHPQERLPEGSEFIKESRPWKEYNGAIDYDKLWDDLLRYQSPSGWITAERGIPKLQPTIVVPMRQLLQTQDIFEPLQNDAAEYFERRAANQEKNPQEWANMTAEAIYHRFQQHGAGAADFWEQSLRHPNCGNPEIRRKIAQAVLSGDFLGDSGRPLPHVKTKTIISRQVLAKAYFALASIDAQKALFDDARSALIRQVQQNLIALARIEKSLDKQLIPTEQRALAEASVDLHARRTKLGLARIEQALALDTQGTYQIPLLMLKADTLLRSNPVEAGRTYDTAVAIARREPHPGVPYWDIIGQRAYLRFFQGNLRGAADDHLAAIDQLKRESSSDDALFEHLRRLFTVVRWMTDLRELDKVIALAKSVKSEDERLAGFAHRAEIYGLIDRYRMLEARTSSHQLDSSSAPAETEILRGILAAVFFDFDQALEFFDRAEREWKKLGRPDSAAWCRLCNAEIVVEDIGDLRYARSLLARSQSGQYFPAQTEMLNLRLLVRSGTLEQARKQWGALRKRIVGETFASAGERASALAAALAMELEDRSRFGEFLALLTCLEPPSARFGCLEPFGEFNGTAPPVNELSKELMGLLGPRLRTDDPDSAPRVVLLSDALRYLGDRVQAASMLDAALKTVPRDRIFMRRQLIRAQQRLDVAIDDVIDGLVSDVGRLPDDCAQLRNAVWLEQAEWWIRKEQFGHAANTLQFEPEERTERAVRYWLARADLSRQSGKRPSDYYLKRAYAAAQKLGLPLPLWTSPASPRKGKKDPLGKAADVLQIDARRTSTTLQYFPAKGDRLASTSHSDILANILAATDSTQVAAVMSPWRVTAQGLVDLFEFVGRQQAAGGDTDLCLVTSETLAGIPWEWAFPPGKWRFVYRGLERDGFRNEAIRWMQAILHARGLLEAVDGLAGPRTIEALRKAQQKYQIVEDGLAGVATKRALRRLLPEGTVMHIGLPAEQERSLKRGYGSIGVHLDRIYKEIGVALMRANLENIDWRGPSSVIHITLDFSHTVGEIRLGGGSLGSSSASAEFSARMLTKLIAESRASLKPFVILDPWHSGHPIELLRQQYLRNAFARELLQLGAVRGVLGAGLVESPRVEPYLRGLIGGLHDYDSAGAIAARLQTGMTPAALFTEDPTIPVI